MSEILISWVTLSSFS